MILIITFLFIVLLGSGLVSLGLEDYRRYKESRRWIGWQRQASKLELFFYKIGL